VITADPTPSRPSAGALRRLSGLIAPYRASLAFALGLTLLGCLLNLAVPLLVQGAVDWAASGGPWTGPPLFGLALLAVFAAQAAANLGANRVGSRVGLAAAEGLRRRLYDRLQRVSLSYLDRTPAGALVSRLMDDVAAVQALIGSQALAVLTDLGTALVVSALLLARSPLLFLLALAGLPAYALAFRWFTRRIRGSSEAVRDRLDAVFGRLKAKVDGVLVVKALAREQEEIAESAFWGRVGARPLPLPGGRSSSTTSACGSSPG
jgi:ABC-type multidrug transport system fused ATPase/permease subunit